MLPRQYRNYLQSGPRDDARSTAVYTQTPVESEALTTTAARCCNGLKVQLLALSMCAPIIIRDVNANYPYTYTQSSRITHRAVDNRLEIINPVCPGYVWDVLF